MRCTPGFKHSILVAAAAVMLAGQQAVLAVEDKGQLPLDELRTFADVYNQIRVGYVHEIEH